MLSATATFGTSPIELKAAPASAPSTLSAPDFSLWGIVSSLAGPAVTPASAMGVPVVSVCVGLISGAISSLPVKVYRQASEGGRKEAHDHPAFDLVHDEANDFTSAGHLRGQLVVDALLRGNGFAEVLRGDDDQPVEILRLPPENVTIQTDQNTAEPWFRVGSGAGARLIHYRDMIHVPAPCSLDGYGGTATIVRARNAISLALALEAHAARIMANGARPSGILTAPDIKTRDGAVRAADSFGAQHSGENSGKPVVLFGGMGWTPTEFKSVDAQFMEQRAFQVHEIAKAFNVPPTLAGELAKATLSNSETMARQFLTQTLMPWIGAFKAAYRRALIRPEERKTYSVDFVTDGLLQADSDKRAAFYASMRANGIFTANECRRLENLPDLPDGNTLASPHTTANAAPAPEPANV